MRLRQVATEIYVDDAIREYIVRLVEATRHNEKITGRLLHAWALWH